MRQYFIVWYRLSSADSLLIWYSNDSDGVFVDAEGFVPSFRTMEAVGSFAVKGDIKLSDEEPILHDLDLVKRWLDKPKTSTVDCVAFLAAWNLFVDVARSVNDGTALAFLNKEENCSKVYFKLFWGNNLPAMTPEGHTYIPLWPNDQIAQLHQTLANGLEMFERSILIYS